MKRTTAGFMTHRFRTLLALFTIVGSSLALGSPAIANHPEYDTEEAALVELINDYRDQRGLSRLKVSYGLTTGTDAHSHEQADQDNLHHSNVPALLAQHYSTSWSCWGENVAMSPAPSTGQTVFDAWKASPEHDPNLLDPCFKVLGLARAPSTGGDDYWTYIGADYIDALLSVDAPTITFNPSFEAGNIRPGPRPNGLRSQHKWFGFVSRRGSVGRGSPGSDGTNALELIDPGKGFVAATQLLSAAPGVTYEASAMAQRQSGNPPTLVLELLSGSFSRLGRAVAPAPSSNVFAVWMTVGIVAPAGTEFVRISIRTPGKGGSRYLIDEVFLEAVL
ncbi:MAG: CAP domain-containing protein [Actinomycetota bacterium]